MSFKKILTLILSLIIMFSMCSTFALAGTKDKDDKEISLSASVQPKDSGTVTLSDYGSDGNYKEGTVVTLTANPAAGYEFYQWSDGGSGDGVSSNSSYTVTVDKNLNFIAHFRKVVYTVNVIISGDGSGSVNGQTSSFPFNADAGSNITLSPSANAGSIFSGWNTGETGDIVINNISGNATYTATFTRQTYSITAITSGSGTGHVDGTGTTFHYNDNTTLVAVPDISSYFVCWDNNTELNSSLPIGPISASESHAAEFALKTFTITVGSTGTGTGTVSGGGNYNYGNPAAITATADPGSHFDGWVENETPSNAINIESVESSITLTAVFTKNEDPAPETFTITVGSTGTGTGTVSGGGNYNYGDPAAITATANPGSHFDGWVENETASNTINIESVKNNITLTAIFTKNQESVIDQTPSTPTISSVSQVSLAVTVVGPGSVLPGSGSFDEGSVVVMNVTANPGAHFVRWDGPNGGEVSNNRIQMTGSKSITAVFEEDAVQLQETETPQSGDINENNATNENNDSNSDQVVLDEAVPQATPELPKTGGIPVELLMGLGALMTTGGFAIKRNGNKKEK